MLLHPPRVINRSMVLNIIVGVLAFAGGAVFSYLFLRANAQKKAKLDTEVNKIATKL